MGFERNGRGLALRAHPNLAFESHFDVRAKAITGLGRFLEGIVLGGAGVSRDQDNCRAYQKPPENHVSPLRANSPKAGEPIRAGSLLSRPSRVNRGVLAGSGTRRGT